MSIAHCDKGFATLQPWSKHLIWYVHCKLDSEGSRTNWLTGDCSAGWEGVPTFCGAQGFITMFKDGIHFHLNSANITFWYHVYCFQDFFMKNMLKHTFTFPQQTVGSYHEIICSKHYFYSYIFTIQWPLALSKYEYFTLRPIILNKNQIEWHVRRFW